ncbi:hypothetical protein GOBAR_DD01225 [Gossypium barbadense]|nr:hypothetical protein GOBAR_DD01225 [Gossypium barbadense]
MNTDIFQFFSQVWRLLGSAHAREGAILAEETLAPSRAVTGVAGHDLLHYWVLNKIEFSLPLSSWKHVE